MTLEDNKTLWNGTDSALSDLIKDFLSHFKDANGSYKYVNAIDQAIQHTIPTVIISPKDFLESELESKSEKDLWLDDNLYNFISGIGMGVDINLKNVLINIGFLNLGIAGTVYGTSISFLKN